LRTCDPVTSRGWILDKDFVPAFINNHALVTEIRPVNTEIEEEAYGLPKVAVGDAIILFGPKSGDPEKKVPLHACVVLQIAYTRKPMRKTRVLDILRTTVNTKNGRAELRTDVPLFDVLKEFSRADGQEPKDREIGICRSKMDFAALE